MKNHTHNNIRVRLYHADYPAVICRAAYVGLLGIQLDSGRLRYPLGTQLEIELHIDDDTDSYTCRVPAVVTHLGLADMGLSFLQHDMVTNAKLLTIIATAQRQAPARQARATAS